MSAPDHILRSELERRSRASAMAQGKIRSFRVFCGHLTDVTDETSTLVEVHDRDCPCLGCAQWRTEAQS